MTVGLPAVSGAQITVKVDTVFSSVNGSASLETEYRSQFSNGLLAGTQELQQYSADVFAKGGAVTVRAGFVTGDHCEIGLAGLSILAGPSKTEGGGTLWAVEKVGTALESPGMSFGAAAGSKIAVTETMHSTNASAVGGELVCLAPSQGIGEMSAGVAGTFNSKVPENFGKGELLDLSLAQGLQQGMGTQTLKEGFQRVEMHIECSGQYSGAFKASIDPTK